MNTRSQIFTRTAWDDSKNKGGGLSLVKKWAAVFPLLLVAGCSGVCIVDTERSSVYIRRDKGSFREEPLYVKDNGYVTLQRSETNSFILRSINFAGQETNRREMPLFLTGYGGDKYAFSDEGKRFAYVEYIGAGPIERLRVASTLSPKYNVLPAGVCDNLRAALGYSVFWISPTRILLYAKNPMPYHEPEKREDICILDLDDMRVARLPGYDNYWCGPILLSPSKRYLLASEEIIDTHRYRLHIVDLNAKKEIFVIAPTGDDMDAHGAVWSSDDEVVYAVDGVVYTQKVGSPDKREIFRVQPKRGVWLYAVDSAHGLHYQMFDTRSRPVKMIGGWRVHNLDTNDDRELTGEQITGRVLMNGKRDKIVATVGY
jgi:hypothetical protein